MNMNYRSRLVRMQYLNTTFLGLRGRFHPAIADLNTSWEVVRARPHMKFISGSYLTYQMKADQSGGSPRCRICDSGASETISHIITTCTRLEPDRSRILKEFQALCNMSLSKVNFDIIKQNEHTLCQFLIDPTSMNLPFRVSVNDSLMPQFFKLSRDLCYTLDKTRTNILTELSKT